MPTYTPQADGTISLDDLMHALHRALDTRRFAFEQLKLRVGDSLHLVIDIDALEARECPFCRQEFCTCA